MPHFINFNGEIFPADTPVVTAANRGLRYGDGLFETMRMQNLKIRLNDLHFERLFHALTVLKFKPAASLTADYLEQAILSLCKKNELDKTARIRLNIFRKNGGLYDALDHNPNFLIETSELPPNYQSLNETGFTVEIFNDARKSADRFSSIKTNNYLPYLMGALFAKQINVNDCLILNAHERICDATIANVFWVHDQVIYTPPISEGCIAGVMRRWLLENLPAKGFEVKEKILEVKELEDADELFLTNATAGIRWVETFARKHFSNKVSSSIYPLLP